MSRRRLIGTITSVKMTETALVSIETMRRHPLYGKRYRRSRSFAAHNPANTYGLGDQVEIEEHRPIAKTKHWLIRRRLTVGGGPVADIATGAEVLAAVNPSAPEIDQKNSESAETTEAL